MKKRALSILLVFAMALFAFAGCSSGGNQPATSTAPAASAAPAAPAASAAPAATTDFPTAPIKIIVVRAAGGSADVVARMFAPAFQEALGTNVIVENIDGGQGKVGLSQAFRSTPDGYTLVLQNLPSYVLTEVIEGGVDYEVKKFEPIVGISGREGNVLIVPADSPFQTVQDVIDFDQANPGKLNVAVTSGMSNSALAHAMFMDQTNLSAMVIPYDSGNLVVTAVMGGHVDLAVSSAVAAYQPFNDGSIRVLTTFGQGMDENLPGVPTFSSLFGEEFAYDVTMGLTAPPGTPAEVLDILREAGYKAASSPAFAEMAGSSFNVSPATWEEFGAQIEAMYGLTEASRPMLEAIS